MGLWNDDTYSPQSQRHQGGTAILLSAKIGTTLEEHGVIKQGRIQFAIIRLTRNLRVGILNVYGYTDSAMRKMWIELQAVELPEAEWIVDSRF